MMNEGSWLGVDSAGRCGACNPEAREAGQWAGCSAHKEGSEPPRLRMAWAVPSSNRRKRPGILEAQGYHRVEGWKEALIMFKVKDNPGFMKVSEVTSPVLGMLWGHPW